MQERHTLRALHRISERGYLTYEEYSNLAKAYIYFRELEHRIQMAYGRQTHELPTDVDELAILARKMGLRGHDCTGARERAHATISGAYHQSASSL